jgi:hypothetical protein
MRCRGVFKAKDRHSCKGDGVAIRHRGQVPQSGMRVAIQNALILFAFRWIPDRVA